jgi:death-on-curing protein
LSEVEYLDLEDLLALAIALLGDPPPVRDHGLLESAAMRPCTTVFSEETYPDVWTKAAALMQSLSKHHPLVDGNKRLAWMATAVFLDLNGIDPAGIRNEDVYDFVIDVAAGDHEVSEIADRLRGLVDTRA